MTLGRAPDGTVDVAIVGGGPAGIATALTLARLGADVLVAERSTYAETRVGETLPPGTRRVLSDLRARPALDGAASVPSVGVRSIWGSSEPHDRSFLFHPYGDGWHVDRRGFDAALAGCAEAAGIVVRRGWRLLHCEPEPGGSTLIAIGSADRAATVRAAFVVDATGRASSVARRLGARRLVDDRLVGAFGFFAPTRGGVGAGPPDAGTFTLIEAVEEGWWYSAPLPGGRLVVAFMTDADLCARAGLRHSGRWLALLRRAPATLARTSGASPEQLVRVIPAGSSRADRVAGRGWLAVGDAAIAQDPLSGDGVPRALESGVRGGQVIAAVVRGDADAVATYKTEIDGRYEAYLRRRAAFYEREERWPDALFWARRRRQRRSGRSEPIDLR